MSITLKRLSAENWNDYKSIRLESVEDSPEAFASTYSKIDKVMTEKDWKDWLNAYIIGAYDDDDNLIGCMALLRNTSGRNNHAANIYGAYVKKNYRNQGVGTMLLEKIIEQATAVGIEIIYLHVTVTQVQAINLYKKLGFVSYGTMPYSLRIGDRYFDQECMFLKLKN